MVLLRAPSYRGLRPASGTASRVARASSGKRDTKPELLLRRAVRRTGLRYSIDVASLPGRPDLVFSAARLAVFCDGDFWHGRRLARRISRLEVGHNAPYWVAKIKSNVDRDRRTNRALRDSGWKVLRFWESDVVAHPDKAVDAVLKAIQAQHRVAIESQRVTLRSIKASRRASG